MRPLACMLLLVLSGCTMERSLEEISQELKDVGGLKEPMGEVAALKAPMEQVAALDPTLKAVAALETPLKNVAALKAPLAALGPLATITQPATYVPMFGCAGIVLFLAIWGGIKMGRR